MAALTSDLSLSDPQCFYDPQLQRVLLYSTLLCKSNAPAPGGHKTYIPTSFRLNPSVPELISSLIEMDSLFFYHYGAVKIMMN